MTDVDKRSTHIPSFSGMIENFTGSLVIDTQLRQVQSIVATMAQDNDAGAASVSVDLILPVEGGATVKATLKCWEDDNVTPAAVAADVAWMALGK